MICKHCGKEFIKNYDNQLYCSKDCRVKFVYGGGSPFKDISAGTVGAIGEVFVSYDLLGRGFEVFRSVSPSSSSDLIIKKDNLLRTVEVRTGYLSSDETRLSYPKKNIRSDILAVVVHSENKVIYIPEL